MQYMHLIFVVIAVFTVAIILGPFFKYAVFGTPQCTIINNGDNNNPACQDNMMGLTEEQNETSTLKDTNKDNDTDKNALKDKDKEKSE
jgi:hypothetical protein